MYIDAESRAAIAAISKEVVAESASTIIADRINKEFKVLMDRLGARSAEETKKFLDQFSSDALNTEIGNIVKKHSDKTDLQVQIMRERIDTMFNMNMPHVWMEKVNKQYAEITELKSLVKDLEIKIKKYLEWRVIEDVSTAEIISLYKKCGLTIDQVCSHFKVERVTAYKYVNGDIKDLHMRFRIKTFLTEACEKSLGGKNASV